MESDRTITKICKFLKNLKSIWGVISILKFEFYSLGRFVFKIKFLFLFRTIFQVPVQNN